MIQTTWGIFILLVLLWAPASSIGADAKKKNLTYKQFDVGWGPQYTAGIDKTSLVSNVKPRSWTLGRFKIDWKGKALEVFNLAEPDRVIWESIPGRSFVIGAKGKETYTQLRGSFTLKDKGTYHRCIKQTVDKITLLEDTLEISGSLHGSRCKSRYRMSFTAKSPNRLGFEVDVEAKDLINRTFLIFKSRKEERFYGFGEQFTHIDLKGRKVPVFSHEQGHLRGLQPYTFIVNRVSKGSAGGWDTTYTAIPQYITSDNRGLFLENYEFSYFNLRRDDKVETRVWANNLKGQILYGDSPLGLIEAFTEYSGRMRKLPRWFHEGAVVGIMGGEDFVRRIWGYLKKRDTPISAFWLQDWVGKRDTGLGIRMWWNWELDRKTYPNWGKLIQDFKQDDIEVLGYINPFLTDASSKEGIRTNLFQEAKDAGYLVNWVDGGPAEIDSGGFTGTLVDLTNPDARTWLKDYLKKTMFGLGMKGWMSDFGEALPINTKLYSGESPETYHNRYLEEWARLNQEILEEAGMLDEAVVFIRNATAKSPGLTSLFWAGDQMVTWDEHDGLKSSIAGILSGGFSGMAVNHSDIGGLIGMRRKILGVKINFTRSKELLIRWAEANAFSPVFRTHEGNNPKRAHQFYSSAETLDAFSYFAKIYASLVDYRDLLFTEASTKGHPVMRHMLLEFPNDPIARVQNYQYMLGSDVLVAPVTDPGKNEWQVYLPAGEWVHIWTKKSYKSKGSFVTVPAELGQPPVFYKEGSTKVDKLKTAVESLGVKVFKAM